MSLINDTISMIEEKINSLPNYQFEVGVFVEDKEREETVYVEKVRIGVTNAELMYIHENGSPLQNIPSRPVLKMTADYVTKNWLAICVRNSIYKYIESGFDIKIYERELNKWCTRIENYAREIIYSNDGRLLPNSPKVAAKKGGNHPLFDTSQLARSITCTLVKL